MAMPRVNPNQLLVEGSDDLHAIVSLMEHHMHWPDDPRKRPVVIAFAGSAEELLEPAYLSTAYKRSGLRNMGLILDADKAFASRWSGARRFCEKFFTSVPAKLPKVGLILEDTEGKRCGVWIMPDNTSVGMLETFCAHLVPSKRTDLWTFADEAIETARAKGGDWRDCHRDKARMHTWLAWQDPPGERIGLPSAQTFVTWFKKLYGF